MKRMVFVLAAAATLVACGADKSGGIKIDEIDAENQAFTDGERLAEALVNAETKEEFEAVKSEIEQYKDAYRSRFGGQAYINFLTTATDNISESLGL